MQRSRGWCLTINNYTEDDELLCYDVAHSCRYCVFGKEIAESGTSHLQGYIYFDSLKSFDQVKLLFPTAHIEKQRGTCQQASDYCKKDGDFFENGELPMSDRDKGECGKQAIAERWALAKEGRFEELPPEQLRIYQYIHAKYSTVSDRDELDNYWIWGESGCGKSGWARAKFPTFYWKPINKWWDGYDREDVVLVEDIDPKHADFMGYFLKIWADHYSFNAEVKGGMLRIRPKTVIVTSQYPIEAVFPDYETQAALKRRFKVYKNTGVFRCFVREN